MGSTRRMSKTVNLRPQDNQALAKLYGYQNEHVHMLEGCFNITITGRGFDLDVLGEQSNAEIASRALEMLYAEAAQGELSPESVHTILMGFETASGDGTSDISPSESKASTDKAEGVIALDRHSIKARTPNQKTYIQHLQHYELNFGIGPAGTGKTFLAVAQALYCLKKGLVRRIVLTRPAVEAGEKLGFLPGDLSQKVDPYLRPLYDALHTLLSVEQVDKLLDQQTIEIAPLAFMRGRTLNNSFMILDEAQNTTTDQMKMFLTRMGFGSRAVVVGDISQIDLPKNCEAGLKHAHRVLGDIKGVGFTWLSSQDVVRHALVKRIVKAFDAYENKV